MAQKLKEFEFTKAPRKSKYPWEEWLDGSIYKLTHDEDFVSKPESFATQARQQAAARDKTLKIQHGDGHTVIQAVDKTVAEAEAE